MFIGDPCGYVRFFGPLLSVHFVELTSPISVGLIMCIVLYHCFGWLYTGYYIINDYVKFPLFVGYESNSMHPRVLGWLPPRAGVIQDAAFLNMVKSKREYEEAKHGYGYGSAPNTLLVI